MSFGACADIDIARIHPVSRLSLGSLRCKPRSIMEFEWDDEKSRLNADKHGVSFEEASSVFGDPLALTFNDPFHSEQECRYLTFGRSAEQRSLVVVHTSRGDTIGIISVRPMTPRERRAYEHWKQV